MKTLLLTLATATALIVCTFAIAPAVDANPCAAYGSVCSERH